MNPNKTRSNSDEIKTDIGILNDHPSIPKRLYKSPGCVPVHTLEDTIKKQYRAHSFIPINTWSPLNQHDLDVLLVTHHTAPYQRIRIGSLPTELIQTLYSEMYNHPLTIKELIDKTKKSASIQHKIKAILNYFSRFIDAERYDQSPYFEVGTLFNQIDPTIITSTRDRQQHNALVGLHIDNWDDKQIATRHLSTNRACINLGQKERYLYVIPHSLQTIHDWINRHHPTITTESVPFEEYYKYFLAQNLLTPVIKIRIDPGDYYIAPTETVIHDGFFTSHIDITIMIRSYLI